MDELDAIPPFASGWIGMDVVRSLMTDIHVEDTGSDPTASTPWPLQMLGPLMLLGGLICLMWGLALGLLFVLQGDGRPVGWQVAAGFWLFMAAGLPLGSVGFAIIDPNPGARRPTPRTIVVAILTAGVLGFFGAQLLGRGFQEAHRMSDAALNTLTRFELDHQARTGQWAIVDQLPPTHDLQEIKVEHAPGGCVRMIATDALGNMDHSRTVCAAS